MLSFNCSHAPLRHFPTDSFVRHILLGICQQLLHKFKLPLKWTPCLCTFKLCNCIFQKWIRCVVIKLHFLYSLFHLITKCVKLRSSRSRMFFKVGVLKISQISQENFCVGMSFNKVAKPLWLLKQTPKQAFSYEICESFTETLFYRAPPVFASRNR